MIMKGRHEPESRHCIALLDMGVSTPDTASQMKVVDMVAPDDREDCPPRK